MITNQMQLFFIFIINGIIIGLLFDFFRISRKVIRTSDFVTYIEDILFWILTGFSVLYSIFFFNNGELRLYMFLGILLGAIFYMLLISKYVVKINIKIIEIIKKCINIILIPIKLILKPLRHIFIKPVTFLFINIRKIFTNFGLKLYNMIRKSKKNINIVKNWNNKKDFLQKCRII